MKRNTWQREAVREALGESEGFVSAQSLHASLKGSGSTVGLATVSLVGGILLALGASVPISPYVTTISFLIYLVCRISSTGRERRARRRRTLVAA